MLTMLRDVPFDQKGWIFEDKYDGFRVVAKIEAKVILHSRNGRIISHNYIEVVQGLEGVRGDAEIDGQLVALDKNGVSRFQLLQNALRHKAKLQYCAFDLYSAMGVPLTERKKGLKSILPKHRLIAFSRHRPTLGTRFFEDGERIWKGLWPSGLTANTSPVAEDIETPGSHGRCLHGPRDAQDLSWCVDAGVS